MPQDLAFEGSLAFEEKDMKAIFDYGLRCALQKQIWVTPQQALDRAEVAGAAPVPAELAKCPLLAPPA